MIESRQINIANTKFRAFRQSNKRRIIILQGNCFPRTTDASQEVHRSKMAQVKPESKEILSSYDCVNRRIFWRRKVCCFDIIVMTQMDLPGKQAPAEHCSIPGQTDLPYYCYGSRSTCTLEILIIVIQTETRRLNMTVQL